MTKLWLVVIYDDVEPGRDPRGPFRNDEQRVKAACEIRQKEGYDNGLYRLDIDESGTPTVESFSAAELPYDDELDC